MTPTISTLSLHDALPIYTLRRVPTHSPCGRIAAGIRSARCGEFTRCVSCSRCSISISGAIDPQAAHGRSEEHTSELQSRVDLVCRLLLEKKNGMCLLRVP